MIVVNQYHELDRVFHDSWPIPGRTPAVVKLFGPRRGHVGCQLVVQSDQAIDLEASGLRGDGGGKLPAPDTFQVRFVPLEENTTFGDEPVQPGFLAAFTTTSLTPKAHCQVVRAAPCDLAEVLVPGSRGVSESGRPVVLYVDYAIPADAEAGAYAGSIEVRSGSESTQVAVELEVYGATLPQKQEIKVNNWFNLRRIAEVHDVEIWSEPYWSLLQKYARLMALNRQTMFGVQPEVYGLKVVDGKVQCNYERLERYIRLFLSEGLTEIEGTHISYLHSVDDDVTFLNWASDYPVHEDWFAKRPPGDNQNKASVLGPVPTTPEGHALLRQWLTPFWDFLGKQGWQDMFYQHVFDEPRVTQADHYRHLSLIIRQLMPGAKIIDAIQAKEINGADDVAVLRLDDPRMVVPSSPDGANGERVLAEENRRQVVETWYYTCCAPSGESLNRFIDFPLIRTRLLHWYNYISGTSGYLHWGLNCYQSDQDPWACTVPAEPYDMPYGKFKLPPGDTHVVWPGGVDVFGSMRLLAMRNGIEDYELLALLRDDRKVAGLADEVVAQVIRSSKSYLQDPVEFDRHRRRLLELAS